MAAFYGTEDGTLDLKRRLSVPVPLRRDPFTEVTHERFFLKYGSEGCLQLYSIETWAPMQEKLRRLQQGDQEDRLFVEQFIKDAGWVTVDPQGRITIPSSLQDRAGLGKDVVLHGNLDYIAIWDAARFESRTSAFTDARLAEMESRKLKG